MKKTLNSSKSLQQQKALEFINSGISCNCLVLLKELKLLNFLLDGGSIDLTMISNPKFCTNYTAAYSALITLEKTRVVKRKIDRFSLTALGYALSNYIGLITMLFDGYGLLMAEQTKIAKNKTKLPFKLIRGDSIAEASIHFGKHTVNPLISKIFSRINLRGTICDLGCGLGTRLAWLCKETKNAGLGFENDAKAIQLAKKKFKKERLVSFEKADITRLNGIWEDVTVVMQYFVFHDFLKKKDCVEKLNSYLKHFPNLKCFIYVDVVSPSKAKDQIMPGYDYVHGLLGIKTPTYEETIRLFNLSDYSIIEEQAVPDLPNTFVWILYPNRNLKKN